MDSISDIFKKYANIEAGDLSSNQKHKLYDLLGTMQQETLKTLDEHRMYVQVLQKFRQSSMEDMRLNGKKFIKTLESLLSVGEDGVYSNNQRFIYELIQNVDDCEYENVSDASLEIQFKYTNEPGEIILTYNEKGFTPGNVFAITGIAEASKNISADKVEIGEKGIGFKSVFGIADKVRIESGMFAFELHKDNFTVPVPYYDDFKPVHGTRMTLFMSVQKCRELYRSLAQQYIKPDATLNRNPILFLNKLTHLKMFFDGFRYLEFDVQRAEPEIRGSLLFEAMVSVSVDMKDTHNGIDRSEKNEIVCHRYTEPIIYGRRECLARYGDNAPFQERRHNLIMVFPVLGKGLEEYNGVMYSFLPTQVKVNAPIVMHVPYKLDGSREFVDPQGENDWFTYTNSRLADFLHKVYLDFAHVIKENIVSYIPAHNKYFFIRDNEKVAALCTEGLRSTSLYRDKIFYTTDGTFESAINVVAFAKNETVVDQQKVYRLLGWKDKLFIPPRPMDMSQYGVKVIENVRKQLFKRAMEDESVTDDILSWLEQSGQDTNYVKMLTDVEPVILSKKQIAAIAKYPPVMQGFKQCAHGAIAYGRSMGVTIKDKGMVHLPDTVKESIADAVNMADLDGVYSAYLKKIELNLFGLEDVKDEFALAASNGIVVSAETALISFAAFSRRFDSRKTFTASLEIRQATERLNAVDNQDMTKDEYLNLLRGVRNSLCSAFGERMYNSYIRIIKEAGADKKRFLKELLQNADDCIYPDDVVPEFKLEEEESVLKISYNEQGFTRDNVRAITAIGESTKNLLLSGDKRSIGEKGVGFKSVFGVAESVDIHSNGFDFRLTENKPTVPDRCDSMEVSEGTVMVFRIKPNARPKLSNARILQLCMCLRQLKSLYIYAHHVTILDKGNSRIVTIDGIQHKYKRFEYVFAVKDKTAIKERNKGGRQISAEQKIVCYIPEKIKDQPCYVYSGLPVEGVTSLVPLIIDAPFELTTSREEILQNNWNDVVKEHMYNAILSLMKSEMASGMEIMRYIYFRAQGGQVVTWGNFNVPYLNNAELPEILKKQVILPVLGVNNHVSAMQGCKVIPDFIARVNRETNITGYFKGNILDTVGKTQYVPLLESIGCVKVSGQEILSCLKKIVETHIQDTVFRDGLYAYLSNNQGNISFDGIGEGILELSVFPVKVLGGTDYIQYTDNLYTAKGKISNDEYWILNEEIMPVTLADKILDKYGRVNALTQEVFDSRYQKNLEELIQGHNDDREVAIRLLQEYEDNHSALVKCRNALRGLRNQIPMKMVNGSYKRGYKFLNPTEQVFAGKLMHGLIVDRRFANLAGFLECGDVLKIHYNEMDNVTYLEDEDIEDLHCGQYDVDGGFENFYEIIRNVVSQGLVSDEQIEKYNLNFGMPIEKDLDPNEPFPTLRVKNAEKLKSHIQKLWKTPNPYVEKRYIQWLPSHALEKRNYTTGMYKSRSGVDKSFCQMCKRKYNNKYIELNNIEKLPVYAWSQMYLNLCLTCSKDYIELRNNDALWGQFIVGIMNVNPMSADCFDIRIGDSTITFTATHLAEVQEILKQEGWGKKAPKRKPKLGDSREDELVNNKHELFI